MRRWLDGNRILTLRVILYRHRSSVTLTIIPISVTGSIGFPRIKLGAESLVERRGVGQRRLGAGVSGRVVVGGGSGVGHVGSPGHRPSNTRRGRGHGRGRRRQLGAVLHHRRSVSRSNTRRGSRVCSPSPSRGRRTRGCCDGDRVSGGVGVRSLRVWGTSEREYLADSS